MGDILSDELQPIQDVAGQGTLFDLSPAWVDQWLGMPAYHQRDLEPAYSVIVHFRNREDRAVFSKLLGQKLPSGSRYSPSIWFPEAEIGHYAGINWSEESNLQPQYPVYIISKGRWESRLTSKALDAIGVRYHIIVEPQEYNDYAAVIAPEKILTLPFSNLGQGSIPARNWVWEHAIGTGAKRHWILDDNISGFYRLTDNLKVPVGTGAIFRAAEDFTDRYENIVVSGFNYFMFAPRKSQKPPIILNTRIYSCILLRNNVSYRWRGRYNEDTDLSLRVLKDGWCTVLFNAFLAKKHTTMMMRGGNTDELYAGNGRLKMAESLRDQHPDCVTITEKWGRPQHYVNYKIFRNNKLRLRPDIVIPEGQNDYGMTLQERAISS